MKKLILNLHSYCMANENNFHFPKKWQNFNEEELYDLGGNLIIDFEDEAEDNEFWNNIWNHFLKPIDEAYRIKRPDGYCRAEELSTPPNG